MPSSLCDLGLGPSFSLSEYADDLFLESALASSGNLENLDPLFFGTSSSKSSHPNSEDSFYPPDNTPVLSDEIWKKFDLPEDETSPQWSSCVDEASPPFDWNSLVGPGLHSAMSAVLEGGKGRISTTGKELRNHDCMWAGECKNKEHVRNRSKSTGNDQRVVAPGQTLLKNPVVVKDAPSIVPSVMMKAPSPMLTASPTVLRVPRNGVTSSGTVVARTSLGKSVLVRTPTRPGRPGEPMSARVVTVRLPTEEKDAAASKSGLKPSSSTQRTFSAGGTSPRPETPMSLSEEEDEEAVTSKCDIWGSNSLIAARGQTAEDLEEAEAAAALAEAMALAAEEDDECGEAVSLAEVTGQVRMSGGTSSPTVSSSSSTSSVTEKTNACYLDHDYHKSQSSSIKSVKTDHLGVQTPSDSEEEIDVVSLTGGEKPVPVVRSSPAVPTPRGSKSTAGSARQNSSRVNLPTNPSARDKHQLQLTVEAAIAKVSANVAANGFGDEFDEEYGDSEEEDEEEESEEEMEEEEEEDYEGYDSSEGLRNVHGHNYGSRSHGGKTGSTKRHASDDLRGPSAKQSRSGRRHKRRRRQARDEDPDYEGHTSSSGNSAGWSLSTSSAYLSSSSSSTTSPQRKRGGHRKRPHRHSHEGGDSAPENPMERRSMHNTMERQRRIDLRNAFENLRLLVPAVSEKERAAKVTILREAAGFCTQLTSVGSKQQDSIKALRARQVALRAQVSSLRRSLAAAR